MNRRPLLLLLVLALALPATAVTITERPDVVSDGQVIWVSIRDLPENATFSLLVEASFAVQPNSDFRFQMSQFQLPFGLRNSTVTATLTGTSTNRLEVMKDDTIVAITGKSADGRYTTTRSLDLPNGTYDYFRLSGTSLPTGTDVAASLQVTGSKQGPDTSEISFVSDGVPAGTITLAALVNGRQVLYKTVTVAGPTAAPPSSGSAGTVPEAATPAPGTWKNFTSADGEVRVRVANTGYVGILKTAAGDIPASWRLAAGPYSLVPQNTTFLPPGRISFAVPAGESQSGLAIMEYVNGSWTGLSSASAAGWVNAPVTGTGTYALMSPVLTPPVPAAPVPSAPATIPAATPVPTKAGVGILSGIVSLGIGAIVAARRTCPGDNR
jgi:hypothetical protein